MTSLNQHITPISPWTGHFDHDGYWTGQRGAVFLARAFGSSFRGAGIRIIGHATTERGAKRVIAREVRMAAI